MLLMIKMIYHYSDSDSDSDYQEEEKDGQDEDLSHGMAPVESCGSGL